MDKKKTSFNETPPVLKSVDSESLHLRLAKAHASGPYTSVNKRYLGDSVPIFVDHNH